jgi:hypothetical protein
MAGDRVDQRPSPERKPWVISIHGIKTRGVWQKQITETLGEAGIVHVPLDYGNFLALQLLLPWTRRRKVTWFRDEYAAIRDRHEGAPCIIAHSFGTYLVCSAMLRFGLEFDQVVLCGSIVREDFPWNDCLERGLVKRVLNDYGQQDLWASVVGWVVNDAGGSGVRGFDEHANGKVIQRQNPEFGHSDFFYGQHYKRSWVPFLMGGDPGEPLPDHDWKINWRFQIVRAVVAVVVLLLVWTVVSRDVPWRPRPQPAIDPCFASLIPPPGKYRHVVWMQADGLALSDQGCPFPKPGDVTADVWNQLSVALSDEQLPGLWTIGGLAQKSIEGYCKKPLPSPASLGATSVLTGSLTLTNAMAELDVWPEMVPEFRLKMVDPVKAEIGSRPVEDVKEELVGQAALNLLRVLGISVSTEKAKAIAKTRGIDAATQATQAFFAIGVPAPAAPTTPDTHGILWPPLLSPRAAFAGDETALQTLLTSYCTAMQSRDREQVARLQELTPEQLEALDRYFAAAPDLTVQCRDVQVLRFGEEALVTFTRRDDFTDANTYRPSHIEVRLSAECRLTNGEWRIVAFKRAT